MRRYQRFATLTRLLLLVVLVVNTFAPAITLRAQETTPDAPPIETTPDITPVEIPTETPTETPTDSPPVVIPPQNPPTAGSLFLADFNNGDTSAFLITGDWAVSGDSATFTTSSASASAIVNGMLWQDLILVTSVTVGQGGEAVIGLRVGAESYAVRISDSGVASLWRGLVQLNVPVVTDPETTPDPLALPVTYEIAISAVDGAISVAVDNITQISIIDPLPLGAGYVVFGSSATSAGVVGYDNILIQAQVPVTSETPVVPVEPVETPIIIPPLDPTPETPVVEVTEEPVVDVEVTEETPVVDVEVTEEPVVDVEVTEEPVVDVEVTEEPVVDAETTPEAEITPEAEVTPEAEITPEVTETPAPLSLDEVEIAKLQGTIYGLLEAYYGGDNEVARAFAESRSVRWLDDDRLQVWAYPSAIENIPAIAATLLELGGEVLYLGDSYVDVIVTLDMLVTLARDGRIEAITLPVFATPTSIGDVENSNIGTPQLLANTGTGSVIPHTLDMLGISSWHEANFLGGGINIAVIDTGFVGLTGGGERACLGSANTVGGNGSGNHGLNVIEILCDVAPSASVYPYTATTATDLATRIDQARAGGQNGFPAAQVILVTMNPGATVGALTTAVNNAFNNNVPVIASAGNSGGGKNSVAFSFVAGGSTTVFITARAGDTLTLTYTDTTPNNATAIQQVNGTYADSNVGAGTSHSYIVGSECSDGCQLELTITRSAATASYAIASSWGNAVITPDSSVTINASASQLIDYTNNPAVFAVGSVCGTQAGRFPLTTTSPRGSTSQVSNGLIKPDVVAPTHVNTSLSGGASVDTDYTCSGGFSGASASAAHVAGMAALVISNSNMFGINNVNNGRPWQLYSYFKSRAIDVNANSFDAFYGAGVAQLGDPGFNLQFERTLNNGVDGAGYTAGNTLYVSSDSLSNINFTNAGSVPVFPTPNGTIGNPFTHVSGALSYAIANPAFTRIVLLPGEYPTAFNITRDGLTIVGYDYADSGDHPASRIWVSDIGSFAGISLLGRNNVTIAGLEFYGATPDYSFTANAQMSIAPVVPMYIAGSGNSGAVVIENNTFANFDAPIELARLSVAPFTGNENVTFRGNTFTGFNMVGSPTRLAAALWIQDSGATTPILVERNYFVSNSITLSPDAPQVQRAFNAVVFSQRSSSRIFGNRFASNTTPSAVGIDMFQEYPDRLNPIVKITGRNIVFSNAIYDNAFSGPVVHLMQGNEFQFINNTVANNTLSSTVWQTMIGLGGRDEDGANVFADINDHKWDIHNNIFFANRNVANNSVGQIFLVNEQFGLSQNFTCTSLITNTAQQGARYNWFVSSLTGYQGDCGASTGTPTVPAGNNLYTNIDTLVADNILAGEEISAFYVANFFTSTNDPDHPYRLRPDATTNGVTPAYDPSGLVMDGLVITGVAGTTTLTNKNPSTDPRALDALGNPRFVSQVNFTFERIDYGAYELTQPDPIEFFDNSGGAYGNYSAGNFDFTMNEDGTASINLIRMVRLGFKPYTVEIVPNVNIYDTNPLNSCNGQPYLYDPISYILTYCPPADFHNQGISDPLVGISFQYRVTGLFNTGTIPSESTYATVTVKINNVDDGTVTAATQKHATDLVSTIAVPLRPRFSLSPFSLTDANGNDNKDYPFTFSNFVETLDANNLLDGANIASMVTNGVFTYTPPPGAVQGLFEFTYRATDQDGDFATRTLRMRVVDKILTQGLHDNTALGITYTGTWTPVFNDVSYSRSLHSTTDTNARATFNFTGNSFAIGYTGNGSTTGAIGITIDPTGLGTYTNVFATPGLTCTPTSSNPTAATGRVVIRCTGVDGLAGADGEVHTVRIDNDSANAFRLDWVQVDAQPLTVGMYEDTDLRPYLSGTGFSANAQSLNGSWELFVRPASQISFSVATSVKRIVLFRPLDNFSDHIKVQLSGDSCTSRTVFVDTFVVALSVWEQPYTVNLGGCTNVVISRNNTLAPVIGIDRIQLLGDEQPLGVGTYHPKDLYEYFSGRNGIMPQARALTGEAQRLLSVTGDSFVFNVTPDVKFATLYRDNHSVRDPIRVRTDQCAVSGDRREYDVTQNGPETGVFEPFVVSLRSCTRVSFTRVPVTAAPAFDRLILSSSSTTGTLSIGTYDNLDLATYFTNAVLTPDSGAHNGSLHILPNTGASMTFTVAPTVQRLTIFRPITNIADDLKVDLSGSCTQTTRVLDSFVIALSMPNQPYTINLNGCTTVTIRKNGTIGRTGAIGIDRIQLHGAQAPLAAGEYHTQDLYEYFTGRNGIMPQARAVGGFAQRLLSVTNDAFDFSVTPDVKTVVLYRDNFSVRDPIRVTRASCVNNAHTAPFDIASTGTDSGGFEPAVILMLTCTRLQITRVPVQAAPAFDRIILLPEIVGALNIGEYDNLELASRFTGGLVLGNSAASDGSWHRLDGTASLSFTVNPTVKRMIIYRPMDDVRDDLNVALSGGGSCVDGTVRVDTFVIAIFMWNQPHVVDLRDCTNVVITRAATPGKTGAIGVDRIQLLGAETALGLGIYHTKDLAEYFYGRNAQMFDPNAQEGVGQRLLQAGTNVFRFDVQPNVSRVVLYRHNLAARDPIRYTTSVGGSCVPQTFTVVNDGLATDWGFPIVIDLNGCTRVSFDRVPVTAAPSLERLVLLPAPAPTLTSGNLYEEYDPGLVFTGAGWTQSSLAMAQPIPSHRLLYSNTLNAAVTFTVTGNGFVVYHRAASGASNNIEVCVTTGANTSCTNYSTQSAATIAQYPIGIYGLGNGTHTVTITNKHAGGNLFIDAIRVP